MDSFLKNFIVNDPESFSLQNFDTSFTAGYDKDTARQLLDEYKKKLALLQDSFYAAGAHSLLIIFQAMDAAGKDSAIKHVMSGVNPQGCQVFSFKQPGPEDLLHDFLWRHYKALPERGRIGIHNRSHYENVLICKVHPELVLKEKLPGHNTPESLDHAFWKERYKSINHFEKHLSENGTVIIKFFLHLSKDEQKKRFLKRIDDRKKNWKFSEADIHERAYWDKYMEAYNDAITHTSTSDAPWFVIPADHKWFTRIAVIHVIVSTLQQLKLAYPSLPEAEAVRLKKYQEALTNES